MNTRLVLCITVMLIVGFIAPTISASCMEDEARGGQQFCPVDMLASFPIVAHELTETIALSLVPEFFAGIALLVVVVLARVQWPLLFLNSIFVLREIISILGNAIRRALRSGVVHAKVCD